MRRSFVVATSIAILLVMPVTALASREASPEGWTDRLVVTYRDEQGGALPLGMRALRGGARHVVVDLGRPAVPSDLRRFNDPSILRVEPDRKKFVLETPNDPGYANQWGTSDAGAGANDFSVRAEAAWDLTTGSALLTVAVLDTGITTHTEFSGRLVAGYDFIDDVDVANDGDGRDSDPSDPGDWITGDEDASGYFAGCGAGDSSWHGTHVAGTIGAAANNAVGIAGLNWNSKIQPIRVLGKCGGYDSDIADAIYWAAGGSISGVPANSDPAKVINLSLGGFGPCSGFLQDAIDGARALGAIVVVAAGNSNSAASLFSPANCDGVVTVAATSRDGERSYYSNYGGAVEIAAPGGDAYEDSMILSTINLGTTTPGAEGYAYYQGTSMAAPHVAGVISLLLSLDPYLSEFEVLELIAETATPFPADAGANPCSTAGNCGAGIINAAELMAAASPVVAPAVLTDTSFLVAPEVGEAVSISEGTWSGTRGTTFTYSWYQCSRSGEATSVTRGRAPSRCSRIRGAEAVTYTPVVRDYGRFLRLAVTATNIALPRGITRFSAASAAVVSAPQMTRWPRTVSSPRIGRAARSMDGRYVGTSPITKNYAWYSCTNPVSSSTTLDLGCTLIAGAISTQMTPGPELAGLYLMFAVTASNAYGSVTHYAATSSRVR